MDRVDRTKLWIYLTFRIFLVVAGIMAILTKDWTNLALSLVTIFLTFLPAIIKKEFAIYYPGEFEILILFFIYASMYLGEIHSFYYRFWWWDIFLHALSGIIVGAIGFSLVYIFNNEKSVAIKLSPVFVAIFSFSFALSMGGLWEVFEFLVDSLFGLNMQKSGLLDTMWDLIVNTLGALATSILGYLYLKGDIKIFEKIEKRFIRQNPRLFEDN